MTSLTVSPARPAADDPPTMISLQIEKARIGALDAESQLSLARAASRSQKAVVAAGLSVRKVLLPAILALSGPLLSKISSLTGAQANETDLHYQLSDVLHDALGRLGKLGESAAQPHLPEFGERFRRGCRPRDLLTVSQWADRHRWLESGTNAPGRWRTALTPYLRDIMDDLSEHSPVRTVVLCKGSGVGGTEVLYNWLGYVMAHLGNRDILHVSSTLELRDRSFNPRLNKLLRETPALSGLVSMASRSATNRTDVLEYSPLARLIKAGANSPDSLSSDHVPYVALDEVDRYPWDVGGEGDPLILISNRQRSFTRAKTLMVSTPTHADHSRIWSAYLDGDQRRLHVPCPHCQHYHELHRDRLRWRLAPRPGERSSPSGQATTSGSGGLPDPNDPDRERPTGPVLAAWFICPACGSEIEETSKCWLLEHGRWIPGVTHANVPGTRSYQMSAAYSPVGLGLTWRALAQRLVTAQSDTTRLKAVINTDWGEVYKETSEAVEGSLILLRREAYTREQLESEGRLWRVTAWTDVQKDRLEMTVVGWGQDEEAWVLDHVILAGETAREEVWQDLALAEAEAAVDFSGVDSGYNASMVLAYVAAGGWRRATKGAPGTWRPIIEDPARRAQRLRRQRRAGPLVEPLGVDQAKAIIHARIRQESPGPGYLHFPIAEAFDREYFDQIAAEELRRRLRNGRVFVEWVQTRARNEALDCLVGNLAICRLAGPLLYLPHKRRRGLAQMAAPESPPAPSADSGATEKIFDLNAAIANAARALRGRR